MTEREALQKSIARLKATLEAAKKAAKEIREEKEGADSQPTPSPT